MIEETASAECAICEIDITLDDSFTTHDSQIICGDCMRMCERCDDVGSVDECFSTVDGNERWCESCIDAAASWCDSCEEYYSEGLNYISDRGSYWCGDCVSNNASYCEWCDEYNQNGCGRCDEEPEVIHDYNYRPDLIFHSTDKSERLFFGMELELECRDGRLDPADYASRLESHDLGYLKSDGSLSNGFEIVTHPMSHDFFKNEADELWTTIENLRTQYKVMTWGASTTGVHIHISRSGFNGGAHMHRFLNLVYTNQNLFSTIAGRESDRWAKFDDVKEAMRNGTNSEGYTTYKSYRSFAKKLKNGHNSDRYSAVNTQNRDTLEMRIFKSTTKIPRLKAYLDLAHASVEYTRTMALQQVKDGALSDVAFLQYVRENGSLYSDLVGLLDRLEIDTVWLTRQNVSN